MNNGSQCPTFTVEVAHASDLGMRRMNNQDSLAAVVTEDATVWNTRGHLLVVADGMGAHAAGELASKLAVDNVTHTYFKLRDLYPPAALRQAIREANQLIHSKGQSSIGFQGMGTTCSCLVLLPQGALVAHIGDSRVYRVRGNRIAQLTFDHSLVWEMAAAGQMSEEDVPACIPKNVITRSLGPHEAVNIDVEGIYDAAHGDAFLLCSDGLTGQLTDAEIGAIVHCLPPPDAVQTLVDLANLRGGPDNISIIVARMAGEPSPQAKAAAASACEANSRSQTLSYALAGLACLVVMAYCLSARHWLAAAVAAAGFGAAVTLIVTGRGKKSSSPATSDSLGGPYGNGPYRQTPCDPNRKVVDSLASVADKLRGLPQNNGLKIEWQAFDDAAAAARAAAEAGDFTKAIERYSAGIRDAMKQLRQQRGTVGSDSGVHQVI